MENIYSKTTNLFLFFLGMQLYGSLSNIANITAVIIFCVEYTMHRDTAIASNGYDLLVIGTEC
jgi:hypothetical protein